MNTLVRNGISLYCDSYLALKKPLFWKTSSLYIKLCALSYAFEGHNADPDTLLDAIDFIKKNSGTFSYLRSARVYSAAYLTAGKRNIESEFPRLTHCYDVMKKAGFSSSSYLPIAAYALYSTTPKGLELSKAETAKLIYEAMKKQHRFLTSSDDYASAVILASSDRPISEMMQECEETYQLLKASGLWSGNGLQFLSQILVFDPASPNIKAERCKAIADRLKQYKNRVSSMHYSTIGFFALTGEHWQEAINEALEAVELIKEMKCYKFDGREFNLMLAAALVCMGYLAQKDSTDAMILRIGVGTTVQAIVAAQAVACATAASAAAAASSSSS